MGNAYNYKQKEAKANKKTKIKYLKECLSKYSYSKQEIDYITQIIKRLEND